MLDGVWSVALDALYGVGALDAVVTRPAPDDTPIATSVLWVTPTTDDAPQGQAFRRREPVKIAALRKADVPTLPHGTQIVAAEVEGGPERTWRVDRIAVSEPDLWRAVVVAADES